MQWEVCVEVEWEEAVVVVAEEEEATVGARTGEIKAMVEHMVVMVKAMVPAMMVMGAGMIIMEEEEVTEAMEATITQTMATMVNTPTGISYYVALASSRLCVLLSAAARLPLLHANVGLYIHVIKFIKGVLQYMHYTFI